MPKVLIELETLGEKLYGRLSKAIQEVVSGVRHSITVLEEKVDAAVDPPSPPTPPTDPPSAPDPTPSSDGPP